MREYCISKAYTINEAIDVIEESHNRAVLVINDNDSLIGVLSQGDIIRAIINGKSLYSTVDTILKPNYYYLLEKNLNDAYKIFKSKKITILPIIDQKFNIIDIITLDDIYNFMEKK